MAHLIARLGQDMLRRLYAEGAQPAIEAIMRHLEEKTLRKIA